MPWYRGLVTGPVLHVSICEKRISEVFAWDTISYLTYVILPRLSYYLVIGPFISLTQIYLRFNVCSDNMQVSESFIKMQQKIRDFPRTSFGPKIGSFLIQNLAKTSQNS